MAQPERITTAIREMMSRGQPPKSTSPVRAAHTEFVAALAGNAPRPIHSETDWEAIEGRANHALGIILDAATEMRGHENWRAL
jgi:hypothetical protein